MNQTDKNSCLFLTYNIDEIQNGRYLYTASAFLVAVLILPATFLNCLLIRSLHSSLYMKKPSTLLLYSLSVSNLLMGITLQPVYVVKKVAELNDYFRLYCKTGIYLYITGYVLATASLFTVTSISIDRYLIVHSGIRYSILITKGRMLVTVVIIWVFAIVLSTAQFYLPRSATFQAAGAGMAICVLITTASYSKIVYTLRKNKVGVQELSQGTQRNNAMNAARYDKSAITMMYVYVVFLICYLPYLCTMMVGSVLGESFVGIGSAESIATAIAYAKSTINPLILLLRIKHIQNAAKFFLPNFTFRGFSRVAQTTANVLSITK